MTSKKDTRWVQRFEKYRKAFEVFNAPRYIYNMYPLRIKRIGIRELAGKAVGVGAFKIEFSLMDAALGRLPVGGGRICVFKNFKQKLHSAAHIKWASGFTNSIFKNTNPTPIHRVFAPREAHGLNGHQWRSRANQQESRAPSCEREACLNILKVPTPTALPASPTSGIRHSILKT